MASTNAAGRAVELGYRNVYAFRQGLPGWINAGYPVESPEKLPRASVPVIKPAELRKMLDADEAFTLLDTDAAYGKEKGLWIDSPKRVAIDLDDLVEQHTQLDSAAKIVIIDLMGKRSNVAGRFLLSKGFENVVRVEGGMYQWVRDGYAVAGTSR